MKKSKAFKLAQFAVLEYEYTTNSDKLEILRVLMDSEDFALFSEKQEEKEKEHA